MKQIGAEIGVNESRVSQLHARAIRRLKDALRTMVPAPAATSGPASVLAFPAQERRDAAHSDSPLHAIVSAFKTAAVVVKHPGKRTRAKVAAVTTKSKGTRAANVTRLPRRTPATVVALAR